MGRNRARVCQIYSQRTRNSKRCSATAGRPRAHTSSISLVQNVLTQHISNHPLPPPNKHTRWQFIHIHQARRQHAGRQNAIQPASQLDQPQPSQQSESKRQRTAIDILANVFQTRYNNTLSDGVHCVYGCCVRDLHMRMFSLSGLERQRALQFQLRAFIHCTTVHIYCWCMRSLAVAVVASWYLIVQQTTCLPGN